MKEINSLLAVTCRQIAVKTFGPSGFFLELKKRLRGLVPLKQKDVWPAHLVETEKADLTLGRDAQSPLVRRQSSGEIKLQKNKNDSR